MIMNSFNIAEEIIEYNNDIILKNVKDFDIEQTLECGQCFHFIRIDKESKDYVLSAYGRLLHISQSGDTVTFHNTSIKDYKEVWEDYFDLKTDYSRIKNYLLKHDSTLKEAIDTMSGVRILNQEFFETLISFIISQNKQIPHIKKIVSDISAKYGTYLGEQSHVKVYAFPGADTLVNVSVDELKELKTGFRAPYIADAVAKVYDGSIDEKKLREASLDECEAMLTDIKGVGTKVANCTMLFGLGKREAFPVDVWIKRIMEYLYFNGEDTKKEKIAEFAKERFGEYGGYAQQYLFYYGKTIRMGVKKSK